MSSAPSLIAAAKKPWWVSNRKIVEKYIADARFLIVTQQPSDVSTAITHLDAALALCPPHETALELKARSLLFLRKFKDVADLLQDYIPSFAAKTDDDNSSTSLSSSSSSSRERVKLLPSEGNAPDDDHDHPLWCFSVSGIKRKVLAGMCNTHDVEGYWRYMVLGQACCHLGMMDDAMVLLQTGKRLAAAACRRESRDMYDDNFSGQPTTSFTTPPPTELESAGNLLVHIKSLLRRRAAAVGALDAGLPAESIRHFSKILEGRRGLPHAFAASCFIGRAAAYKAAGRVADSIADCNRALALDPTSIPAMRARADLLDSVRAFPDCLRDLDHLKLLYDAILRDRKLPGPPWRPSNGIRYRDIPGELRALSLRIQELRQRVAKGGGENVDYYGLIGVKRGCTRSELERTHLLLSLRHRPEKSTAFVERLDFADEHRDLDIVRDQAKMSGLVLYRLLQKGHTSIMSNVVDEEAAERQRLKDAAEAKAAMKLMLEKEKNGVVAVPTLAETKAVAAVTASVFQGVFCRDMAVVGSMLSHVGFSQSIPMKYEALRC